jgi:hypothetical protein
VQRPRQTDEGFGEYPREGPVLPKGHAARAVESHIGERDGHAKPRVQIFQRARHKTCARDVREAEVALLGTTARASPGIAPPVHDPRRQRGARRTVPRLVQVGKRAALIVSAAPPLVLFCTPACTHAPSAPLPRSPTRSARGRSRRLSRAPRRRVDAAIGQPIHPLTLNGDEAICAECRRYARVFAVATALASDLSAVGGYPTRGVNGAVSHHASHGPLRDPVVAAATVFCGVVILALFVWSLVALSVVSIR